MDPTPGAALVTDFSRACLEFAHNFKNASKIYDLVKTLNFTAQALAESELIRDQAGQDDDLWKDLNRLWRELSRTQLSFWANDDSDDDDDDESDAPKEDEKDKALRAMCASLAKFSRNLVAGVPANQLRAFDNEPELRRLLHYYTSWSAMEDEESVATARMLTQALSNTVTANDALVERLWETYMILPEDQVVLIRLLGSPDSKTLLTTLIFILNCIHGSARRTQLLIKTKVGVRICISLLDNMIRLHEAEEGSEGAKAFDVGYAIFTEFADGGFVPSLYKRFAVEGEIITPHQTTLLKLVDSYLQSTQLESASIQIDDMLKTHESLGSFFAKRFWLLSTYASRAIRRALGTEDLPPKAGDEDSSSSDSSSSQHNSATSRSSSASSTAPRAGPGELDVMLPKACEALVLITQCIVTISLEAEEQQLRLDEGTSVLGSFTSMKNYFCQKRFSGQGVIEILIDLLRQLDLFLPRINFGKPIYTHRTQMPSPAEGAGFSYLKRDLVRLLGVLCHASKDVQNRVRVAGGIPVVMNMCVVDERNPYLREHAIFTLSNILKGNVENQKFVNSIKPSQEWDENGTLKKHPGATLK